MKKFWIAVLLLIPLLGCRSQSGQALREWMADTGKLKVLSTTAQIGDLVQEIGRDRVDSWVLIQGALDPHSYELVKGDGEKLARADLIFYNGLGLEHGAGLFRYLQTSSKAEALAERILKIRPDKILRKQGAVDPHVWMDISLWKEIIDPIVERLSALDAEGAPLYRERGSLLKERMEAAHRDLARSLQAIPQERRYLVSSHDAFEYFARSYLAEAGEGAVRRFAAPEGLAPDGQMAPDDIRQIISFVKDHRIGVIFPESNVSRDSIHKIVSASGELGIEVKICQTTLYGDAMDKDLRYLDMMRHNADVICEQLGGPQQVVLE